MSNKKYNQGFEDASKLYGGMLDELKAKDEEREAANRQNTYKNKRLVEGLINKMNQFERQMGGTGTPDGLSVFNPENKLAIDQGLNTALDGYVAMSGFSQFISDPRVMQTVSDFIIGLVENKINLSFHNSLSDLEKNGVISNEKLIEHYKKLSLIKGGVQVGLDLSFTLVPIVADSIKLSLDKRKIKDFILGADAFIGGGNINQLSRSGANNLLHAFEIKIKDDDFPRIIEKFGNDNGIARLPKVNRIVGIDNTERIAKYIVSRCDLDDSETIKRAMAFMDEYLKIPYSEIETAIQDIKASQISISDIAYRTALNYKLYFADFIRNIQSMDLFIEYNMDNDPYQRIRNARKGTMEQVINDVNQAKFLTDQDRKDIIQSAATINIRSLNPNFDVARNIKLTQRKRDILNELQ